MKGNGQTHAAFGVAVADNGNFAAVGKIESASDVYDPTDEWSVAGLEVSDEGSLTIGGRLTNEEVGEGISWSEVWIANIGLDGVGECIASHTWQNTHIIPAGT